MRMGMSKITWKSENHKDGDDEGEIVRMMMRA